MSEDISGVVIYNEDFESYAVPDLGTLQTFSITGPQVWKSYASSSGYQAGNMSGYDGSNVANEDWMILPEIDLTGFSSAELKLSQVLNFLGDGVVGTDVAVKISTDYDGVDPTIATWVDLDLDQWPAGDNWDAVESKVSLADYADQQIYLAFYYNSTVDYAPNWRLIDITVEQGESIATDNRNVFYEYDAADAMWYAVNQDEVYYLASSDYDAMGSPGRFNNFSSSDPASDYLPTLLRQMFPYAQAENNLFVIYKYYSSSAGETQTRGDKYYYTGLVWEYETSVISTEMRLGQNGTTWVPDNTLKYLLTGDDYAFVVDTYADVNPAGVASMEQYGNYDITIWSDEEVTSSIADVLDKNFSSQDDGQKYAASYSVWTGSSGETRTKLYIKSEGKYIPFTE